MAVRSFLEVLQTVNFAVGSLPSLLSVVSNDVSSHPRWASLKSFSHSYDDAVHPRDKTLSNYKDNDLLPGHAFIRRYLKCQPTVARPGPRLHIQQAPGQAPPHHPHRLRRPNGHNTHPSILARPQDPRVPAQSPFKSHASDSQLASNGSMLCPKKH